MHRHVLLQDEDAPPVRPRVLLHQRPEGLQVHVADVVHPAVDLAHVDPIDGELVPVEGVLQEA